MATETTTDTTETQPAAQAPAIIPPTSAGDDLAALKDELAALRADIAKLAETKAAPVVPSTETPKPAITPFAPDPASLPVHARLAAGYTRK